MTELAAKVVNLKKHYDLGSIVVQALRGVSMEFPRGDFVAIMGSSGSGKSTLLNLLGALDRPTSGDYIIGGRNVAHLSDDELSGIRNEMIGFIFQSYNLIPQYTVVENIEVPLHYRSGRSSLTSADRDRIVSLAELVGLSDRLDHRPFQLSGGQQQRVAIARALANEPMLLLADEPTGNLDPDTAARVHEMLLDLIRAEGLAALIATHNMELAALLRRVVHLRHGRLVEAA